MLAVSVIDLIRFVVAAIGLGATAFLFYLAYDIGKDGEWREWWPAVLAEIFFGCIALVITLGVLVAR